MPRDDSAPARDVSIDALRVLALAGIVLGHWLVTGFPTGSALVSHPELRPATWVLQTLGPLFFAAGFAATRRAARPFDARPWVLLSLLGALWWVGGPVVRLALSPLWFAVVLLVLGRVRAVLDRSPWWLLVPVAVVALLDLSGAGFGLVRVLAVWVVPYGLGVAHAQGRLANGPALAVTFAVTGVSVVVLLVGWAGFTASAVGIPGVPRSPLNPPGTVAAALGVAQIGVFLAMAPVLRELLRGAAWVTRVNRWCLPVYLLHLPLLCVLGVLGFPGVAGDVAADGWLGARVVVLPALAVVLFVLSVGLGQCVRPRLRVVSSG